MRRCTFDPAMKSGTARRHLLYLPKSFQPAYIGAMTAPSTAPIGPVATEMRARLTAALAPTRLTLIDDSEAHRGHGGHNPAGESHFALEIESEAFIGLTRVARQRLVYQALGDLMHERVHALTIKADPPNSPPASERGRLA